MFGVLIGAPYGDNVWFLPDQGASWYYWKLPDPSATTRIVAWGSYLAHQLAIWWLIYQAQHQGLKYVTGLHPLNILALSINAAFVIWHILQTRIFYDGLAQDVSVWSSMGSVTILLMVVIIMENQRRGVVLGRKWGFLREPGRFLRKYHGYYFSWAIIYTFWYHPIEMTLGHLLGTFYILMLLLQGSLFFTRSHVDRHWTAFLEVFVLLHGAIVAWMSIENQSWEQFAFGFALIFLVTQMHGLGWTARARWLSLVLFVSVLGLYYRADILQGIEVSLRIPLIYLVAVPLLAAVVLMLSRLLPTQLPD